MNVEDIRLINFRNYDNIYLKFNPKINVFIGKNAQGKTNLLEAIYMCAYGKSFRTNRDKEIINFSKEEAYIGSNMNINNYDKFLEIKMDRVKSKRIRINKNELKNYKELYSGLNVVIFSPDDLKIVKEGPSGRRDFMDVGISKVKPVYTYNISRYNKILFQRNNLLKSSRFKKDLINLLDVFDMQIASIGTSIILERQRYVEKLSKIANTIHKNISSNNEELELKYISNVPIYENKSEMEKSYLIKLKENYKRDAEFGTTEVGPHKDDIYMSINDKDVRTYGSQGQQRTVVLSLKFSEVELIKAERGMYPVLLLDDVFSELDDSRRNYLISLFKDVQTFITVTDAIDLKSMNDLDKSIFYIENGNFK